MRGEGNRLPVATELAFVEDFADQVEVLVFFVPGCSGGGCRSLGGRIVGDCHFEGVLQRITGCPFRVCR